MNNLIQLSDTVIPWLLGGLLSLSFIALLVALKYWRDMKRSPFFFMRQQASKRLQSYVSISFVALLLAAAVGTYGWQAPADEVARMGIITNAKPVDIEVQEIVARQAAAREAELAEAEVEEVTSSGIADLLLGEGQAANFRPELPAAFDRYEPQAELNPDTNLGQLVFSTDVTEDYDPVQPAKLFGEGFFTLFATFDYLQMADGMEWAWVWRHNGEVVDGGNELWQYGDEGPGYIYLSPEEGFQEGRYSLEIWVNGELLSQGEAIMNEAALSAGN